MSRFGGMRPYGQKHIPEEDRIKNCPSDKFISREPLGKDFNPNKGIGKYVSFFSYIGISEKQFLEAYREVLELSLENVRDALEKISRNREEN